MQTVQVNVLNPKAYKILQDLADLELISLEEKEELKSKTVSDSLRSDSANKKVFFKEAFGAFESKKTAEEIIEDIQNSRISNRDIEQF